MKDKHAFQAIDWEKQWADFAPHFQNGLAHIDLEGKTLLLKPGAGFGDLSHPTTRPVMKLMGPYLKDKIVFDIGCGSGILSLAAALLGAKQVYGIDIDDEAIKHSQENAALNDVESHVLFSKGLDPAWVPKEPFLIVMNMIESEQRLAWEAVKVLHKGPATLIVSGLLSAQITPYLQLAKARNWALLHKSEEESWLGLILSINT